MPKLDFDEKDYFTIEEGTKVKLKPYSNQLSVLHSFFFCIKEQEWQYVTVRSEFENYVLWNKIVPYLRNVLQLNF